jgi:hypothetical protein
LEKRKKNIKRMAINVELEKDLYGFELGSFLKEL